MKKYSHIIYAIYFIFVTVAGTLIGLYTNIPHCLIIAVGMFLFWVVLPTLSPEQKAQCRSYDNTDQLKGIASGSGIIVCM